MNTQLLDPQSMNILNIQEMANTTENALMETRENMHYCRSNRIIRRIGWYYTEPIY